jgi:hypothetical protein
MAVPVKDGSRSAGPHGVVSSTQSAEITSRSNKSGMRRFASDTELCSATSCRIV